MTTTWGLGADDLLTGEAVALDLPPAGLGSRIVSGVIDLVVTLILLAAVAFAAIAAALNSDGALATVALIGTLITVFLVLPTAMETLTRGKSVGKYAIGLRTVRDDAGPITFQHAFVRALVGVVEIYAFAGTPAFFTALVSARGKRLGDFAAGTYVVRDRVRLPLPNPAPMPPPLASWARTADVAALPTPLALAARQYLARSAGLDAGARIEVGERLATQLAPYVAPPPPPGTPAEAFLAAVLATRRERDAARLQREDSLRARLTGRA